MRNSVSVGDVPIAASMAMVVIISWLVWYVLVCIGIYWYDFEF